MGVDVAKTGEPFGCGSVPFPLRQQDLFCITYDQLPDITLPVCDNADLSSDFKG